MSVEDLQPGEYYELLDSLEEEYSLERTEATRIFRSRWDERKLVVGTWFPFGSTYFGDPTLTVISVKFRGVTQEHPQMFYGEGFSGINPDQAYKEAVITVRYGLRKVKGITAATKETTRQSWDFSTEILNAGPGRFWEADGTPVAVPVNAIYPLTIYQFTNTFPASDPPEQSPIFATARAVRGTLNPSAFNGDPPGTVLCMGPQIEEVYAQDGSTYYEVTMKFLSRAGRFKADGTTPVTWNDAWHAPVPQYDQRTNIPLRDSNNQLIYAPGTVGSSLLPNSLWDDFVDNNNNPLPLYPTGPTTGGWDDLASWVPAS